MSVHQGRHEMPGWRGYLPDSVDRAARGRPGRPGRGLFGTPSRRVVAVGALAVCAVAGGAVINTRSAGPPDASPGPADDVASGSAGSSAWTREATSVLAAIETELDRTDEVRRRWDASSVARRDGPPPRAVVALLGRQSALTGHRDALRAAMTEVRSGSAPEAALANAWQRLRAAQEMLRALDVGRTALGDPVEATVLRLALDGDASVGAGGGPAPGRTAREEIPRTFEDAATVALTATTSTLGEPSATAGSPAGGASGSPGVTRARTAPTGVASDAVVRPARSDGVAADVVPETAGSGSPGLAAPSTDTGASPAADDQDDPPQDTPTVQGSSSPGPTRVAPPEPTMLTFAPPSAGSPDPGSAGDEQASLPSDPTSDPGTDAETDAETGAETDAIGSQVAEGLGGRP